MKGGGVRLTNEVDRRDRGPGEAGLHRRDHVDRLRQVRGVPGACLTGRADAGADRADRPRRAGGGVPLLSLGRGTRGEPARGAGALRAGRRGVGVRLRLADVEPGDRVRCSGAVPC
jgi:hypothetical protein